MRECRGFVGLVVVVEDDCELVAAEPRRDVGFAKCGLDALAHLHQQPVADQMAAAVVDGLELVEIEVEHHEGRAVTLEPRDRLLEVLGELGAVEKAGQRVVVGQIVDAPFRVLLGGDVRSSADVAGIGAELVEGRFAGQPPMALDAGDRDLQLDGAEGHMLLDVLSELLHHGSFSRLIERRKCVEMQPHQLLLRNVRGGREAIRHALEAAVAIELPEPIAGVLLELLQQQADDVLLLANFGFR